MAHEERPRGEVEKEVPDVYHIDKQDSVDSADDSGGFTEEQQRSIIRRIDRRLVLMVGTLYCVSLMDRVNMSAANIAGMSHDLVLTGYRYVCYRPACSLCICPYTNAKYRPLRTSSSLSPTSSFSRHPPFSSAPSARDCTFRPLPCCGVRSRSRWALSRTTAKSPRCERSSEFSRRASSPAPCTCSAHGTRDVCTTSVADI